MSARQVLRVAMVAMVSIAGLAQAADESLTLEQAQRIGLANRPSLKARQYTAETAQQLARQVEAGRYPQLSGSVTAVSAYRESTTQDGKDVVLDTRIAAGGLNNPTILRRDAAGVAVTQLITDFGRTSSLVESAQLRQASEQQQVAATRAQVLLDVDESYLGTLEAEVVQQVARKTVDARQLLLDIVAALSRSKLKSELEVRFAEVSLDEARLLLLRSQNAVEAAYARLSASLGYQEVRHYKLEDVVIPDGPPAELDASLAEALARRPELAGLQADRDAAEKLREAQKALRYPTVSAFAAAGVVPVGDARFPSNYGAVGVNLSMTLFDGGKISALEQEAKLRSLAASETLAEARNGIANAVRVAWLNAKASYENIAISQHLRDAAAQALKLAESRYSLGITSIVELNQAQLSAIDAEIGYSRAKYRYLLARAALAYQVGGL
jgi:outer membrane protein